jgi:hypothetical protein
MVNDDRIDLLIAQRHHGAFGAPAGRRARCNAAAFGVPPANEILQRRSVASCLSMTCSIAHPVRTDLLALSRRSGRELRADREQVALNRWKSDSKPAGSVPPQTERRVQLVHVPMRAPPGRLSPAAANSPFTSIAGFRIDLQSRATHVF